ncbi:MAG TPA: hypothetical protein VJ860_04615 [Polyangia bacterium]|nr:hypothetical protein [Polyangia bacterium]
MSGRSSPFRLSGLHSSGSRCAHKLGVRIMDLVSQPGTCVAFINQITDCNPGARNVGEFFEAPLEFVNEGPGCRGKPRPMRGSDR